MSLDVRLTATRPVTVYTRNITHNLGAMAAEAGIYMPMWRPDEMGITKAGELIGPLSRGLTLLRSDPERFRTLNPVNGWGSYEELVEAVAEYLAACCADPDADVSAFR